MNKETNTIISNLEECSDMFDYWLTPKASNLLVSYIKELQQENKQLQKELEEYKNPIKYFKYANKNVVEENKKLKDKISKIETLIINNNCDTGDIYYKYNSRFLKSELKQRILEIVYEQGSDSNE